MRVKAVLVGDATVGKTSLYQRLEQNTFTAAHMPTVSGSFARLSVPNRGRVAEIGLWDTAGQERFRTIVPLYFQRASIVLLIFSIDSRQSYDHISEWHSLAVEHVPAGAQFFLIGNKCDLDDRQVGFEEAHVKANELNAQIYLETSASTGAGCDGLIGAFARYLESEDNGNAQPEESGEESDAKDDAQPAEADESKCC
jgi:small GTP-binding protein